MSTPEIIYPPLVQLNVVFLMLHCHHLQGVPCDMVTGEERRYARPDGTPSDHVACTVEMSSTIVPCKYPKLNPKCMQVAANWYQSTVGCNKLSHFLLSCFVFVLFLFFLFFVFWFFPYK